ncbi:MAG: hypothetical protein CMN78_02500 [Spirochaetales bacterium]|nr:hypothetical protein [Spirochaetales bacterium]
MPNDLEIKRITDLSGRNATLLSNGIIRVVVADKGGMVPELSTPRGNGWLNAHWLPHFRANSGIPYNESKHGSIWPVELLYELAGNFPCFPNFGPPGEAYGVSHQAHGLTANGLWNVVSSGVVEGEGVYVKSAIAASPEYPSLPVSYTKVDVLLPRHPVHYTLLTAKNAATESRMLNAAWHNTVAPPFLCAGCLIDACADRFATAPGDGEFDTTGRLVLGADFADLQSAPLKSGGTTDLRTVPGMIGYSDFVCGAVPENAAIGWSSVTNPILNTVYLTFFKGPTTAGRNDMILNFNDYWMQYGGRSFPPWAFYDGGTDLTFCLGTENATGAYANGLQYALDNPEILGKPTLFELAPGEEKTLSYGTALFAYQNMTLSRGVNSVELGAEELIIEGYGGESHQMPANGDFKALGRFAEAL